MARVLLIDDDADIRPLMRVTLNKLGHQPTLAALGEEGLRLAENGQFDLVVLDLMMPDLDGYEVTRRLRADPRTTALPILILTARAQPADFDGAIEAGADGYLAKPFDPDVLGRRIMELLKQAEARRAAAPQAGTPATTGRVSMVLGLRGGVGTTTTAVTLAGALLRLGRRVCLVDLSPSGGHVALQLRLATPTTWANLPAAPDTTAVAQHLLRHESGLVVLAAPPQPVRRGPAGAAFQAVLEALQIFFTDVVIDGAPLLDEATWVALGAAERTLLVSSPEVGAVHTAIGTLAAVAGARRPASQLLVVLNHVSPDGGLPQAAVEKALGRAPDLLIPYDRQQMTALTHGTPLIFSQPGALLPTAVGSYAARVMEAV